MATFRKREDGVMRARVWVPIDLTSEDMEQLAAMATPQRKPVRDLLRDWLRSSAAATSHGVRIDQRRRFEPVPRSS